MDKRIDINHLMKLANLPNLSLEEKLINDYPLWLQWRDKCQCGKWTTNHVVGKEMTAIPVPVYLKLWKKAKQKGII